MWTEIYPQDVDLKKQGNFGQPIQTSRGPIHVVIPTWKGDQHQAIRLLEWIGEMGMIQAPFWLACADDCQVHRMLDLARKAFSIVNYIRDGEGMVSNWHEAGDHPKSAAGPNSLFRQVAWNFALPSPKGPWLFLEPDAIPCRRDWYDLICREYEICGKPFMGYQVTPVNHPGVPIHLSGVAVYPPNTPGMAPKAVDPSEVAFDIAGVENIIPNAHFTNLIYHKYRAPGFALEEDFNARVEPGVAIWHACKDGSIIPFLKKRLGMIVATPPIVVNEAPLVPIPVPEGMVLNGTMLSVSENESTVDIFIKTREHDAPWLEWCKKSISKYCSGFRSYKILKNGKVTSWSAPVAHSDIDVFGPFYLSFNAPEERDPGYLWQQVCKLHADIYCGNPEYILYMDSDCLLTREVTPDEFIKDGKPVWLYTPLGDARSDQHVWVPVMERFLGRKPEHEFMRRHPFIVPRWALEKLREFCLIKHNQTLEDYIMAQTVPGSPTALVFSEWNCLGFFLWTYHREKVHWVLDTEAGPACTWQGHTHDTPEKNAANIAEMKRVFEGSTLSQQKGAGEGVTPPPLTLEDAIRMIQAQGGEVRLKEPVAVKKHKGRKPGSKNKPKPAVAVSATVKDSLLLAIHSYPGANETFARHWPSYQKSGATRIVGVGTTDHGCEFPCESVEIGENAYMKMKGSDDHLCRRLINTVKWCLTQPEQRFIISEYDTIWLRKMPHFKGINACKTGGHINGSKTNQFFHNPWCFDRESGPRLVSALEAVLPDSDTYPDNSPDLFFGLACERARIEVGCTWKMFTRNSLDLNGDLDLAVQAARDGVHVIHGVKKDFEYFSILEALNGKHLELSHAQ